MTRVVLLPLGFVVTARTVKINRIREQKVEIVKDRVCTTSHVGGGRNGETYRRSAC